MNWNDVTAASPELALGVQRRFEAHGLAVLATIRADGFPRVSGIEPSFSEGELWLGMMDHSRKGADLRRNPRLALHSASIDKEVSEGDARITGRAIPLDDEDEKAAFLRRFREATGSGPPEGSPMDLFRVDVTALSFIQPAGDCLAITSWSEQRGTVRVERT